MPNRWGLSSSCSAISAIIVIIKHFLYSAIGLYLVGDFRVDLLQPSNSFSAVSFQINQDLCTMSHQVLPFVPFLLQ